MTNALPLIRILQRLREAFWRRRVLHWVVRATWLALLVPTVVMAGYLWYDWQVPWNIWLVLMMLVGFSSLLWSLRPISLKKMAHRLDNLLEMRSQLITAYEVSYTANRTGYVDNPIAEQLVQNAVRTAVALRRQVAVLGRGFWLEVHALIAIAALLGAMLLVDALSPRIPSAAEIELPASGQEPKADEVIPPDPVLMPPPPQPISQAQLQAALEALADALRDQAVSRAAAEALDRGDLGGAAEELRRLADRLEGLSEQARQQLGESLQEAADNMGESVTSLSQPLQSGSQALERSDSSGASQALEQLAEALDSLDQGQEESPQQSGSEPQPAAPGSEEGQAGQDGNGGGDGTGDGSGGEGEDGLLAEEEERLPIDGEPVELESESELDDRVLQPSELDAQATGDERTSDSPFARQPLNAAGDDLGPDALSYPWEKRDIIRQYFTP
jgi:hypothetical protein